MAIQQTNVCRLLVRFQPSYKLFGRCKSYINYLLKKYDKHIY
nr:MAG TPA: hypothetical protein [Caudoviricetes sp.]